LSSTALVPQRELRLAIAAAARKRKKTEEGAAYFSCPFCGNPGCTRQQHAQCRAKFERQLRADAAFGAAARRRRWLEGHVLPSAERALRSGPVGAGALMVGAFSVGAVGAILGGVASSLVEVVSGGYEVCRGVADAATRSGLFAAGAGTAAAAAASSSRTPTDASSSSSRRRLTGNDADNNDDDDDDEDADDAEYYYYASDDAGVTDADQRPSWSRGCVKIASGAVLVPVAASSIAVMFAVGAAAGGVALATGILRELGHATIVTVRAAGQALTSSSSSSPSSSSSSSGAAAGVGGASSQRSSSSAAASPRASAATTSPLLLLAAPPEATAERPSSHEVATVVLDKEEEEEDDDDGPPARNASLLLLEAAPAQSGAAA